MSADCGRFGRPLNDNDDRFVVATLAEPGRWLNGYCTAGVGRLSRVARFIYSTKQMNFFLLLDVWKVDTAFFLFFFVI